MTLIGVRLSAPEFSFGYYVLLVPLTFPVVLLLLYVRWLGWELYTNN